MTLIWLISGCSQGVPPSNSIEVAVQGTYGGAFSEDGHLSIVGSINHGGSLWRIEEGSRLYSWNHHKGEFTAVLTADFSPDGNWALTADDHTLVLWNTRDGSAARYWSAPGEVLSIALSREGRFALLGMSDNTAVIFDVVRGGVRRTFRHDDRVTSVDLSDDSRLAITGSEDHTAVLWELETSKPLHRFAHDEEVQLVRISPNGNRVLSASKYDKAVIWDTESGREIGEIPLSAEKIKRGTRFTAARFSADGNYLLTGLPDRQVQLWDLETMTELKSWTVPKRDPWKPTSAAVVAVSFSSTPGQFYALASNGYIHQLDQLASR